MRFFIEVERQGPDGSVLVTLRDGPTPKIGERLKDEAGNTWTVAKLHPTEIELRVWLQRIPKALPEGMALVLVRAAHAAA